MSRQGRLDLSLAPQVPDLLHEAALRRAGAGAVAGVDEAGRGPLAGPVVAAAVCLDANFALPGVNDSKKMSDSARRGLVGAIKEGALSWALGMADSAEIDDINILQASLLAMRRALEGLRGGYDHVLVDGNRPIPGIDAQTCLIKGDSRSLSIAAASIIAKVERDDLMTALAAEHPGYGFEVHYGYPTAAHRSAIAELGPSPVHRRTFKGVREYL